jgi:predicted nucleic acid-binding protein
MILDAMALSDFLVEEPGIQERMSRASSFNIPVIVLGEYRFGLRLSRHRSTFEARLEALLLDVQILPIDNETTIIYADIRSELKAAGTPIPENDLWIAALVRQYGLPLLSRDSHFDHVRGISRQSW